MTTSEIIGERRNELSETTARQRLIVVLLLGANFMMSADFSILNVALPVVGEAVGLSVNNLPWLTTASRFQPPVSRSCSGGSATSMGGEASSLRAFRFSWRHRFLAAFRPGRLCF